MSDFVQTYGANSCSVTVLSLRARITLTVKFDWGRAIVVEAIVISIQMPPAYKISLLVLVL